MCKENKNNDFIQQLFVGTIQQPTIILESIKYGNNHTPPPFKLAPFNMLTISKKYIANIN